MQLMVDIIRDAVIENNPDAEFIYGRPFDSALDTHIKATDVCYVFLDPIRKTGTQSDGHEVYQISIGFIKQDAPDSSVEEMELIINEMDLQAKGFRAALYALDSIMIDAYAISEIRRIKNVCTGVLLELSITSTIPC